MWDLNPHQGVKWNPPPLWWKCRVLTTGPPGKFPHRIYFKKYLTLINYVVVVQLLSHVQLFATPRTAACQASLSFTISWGLLKLMSIESVMLSNHLILCHPLLILPSIFPSIRVIFNESFLPIRWPKYWSFSLSISPSNEYSGVICFRIDWLDLLAVQQTLTNLVQEEKDGKRSWWIWNTCLSTDTSGIHFQTQKCMQNIS